MKLPKLKINIYNQTHTHIPDRKRLRKLVNYIFKKEGNKSITSINIIVADGSYLRRLNREFFGRNRTTNVISFNLGELGEVYISRAQTRELFDLYYYLAHGLLHILGYDHKTKKDNELMEKKCLDYLNAFFALEKNNL
ncbi:MAG: rRNA maturation RNAse YbeY [candidate division WOR-3 bacterium]